MPKTAQPTAFDVSPETKDQSVEVFTGKIAEAGSVRPLTVEVPRFDCVTVGEELALIGLYSNLGDKALQAELDSWVALLLLKRCPAYQELQIEELNNWSHPMVKALAEFFMAERREHKPLFSEEPKEDGDSPKAGGSTAPD